MSHPSSEGAGLHTIALELRLSDDVSTLTVTELATVITEYSKIKNPEHREAIRGLIFSFTDKHRSVAPKKQKPSKKKRGVK